MRGLLFVFLGAAMLFGAARWHIRAPASRLIPELERKPLPALKTELLDGSPWSLADQKGKVVLINHWATWCGPCQEEMPELKWIAAERGDSGVVVLGMSLDMGDGVAERVRQFVTRFGVTYPVAIDQPTMENASNTIGIPNTLLIDRQGRLAKVYAGPIRARDVADDLRTLGREP